MLCGQKDENRSESHLKALCLDRTLFASLVQVEIWGQK